MKYKRKKIMKMEQIVIYIKKIVIFIFHQFFNIIVIRVVEYGPIVDRFVNIGIFLLYYPPSSPASWSWIEA